MAFKKDLSIIVPVYNEERRLYAFLNDLLNFSKKLTNYEIILVDDGSLDNSVDIMKDFRKKNNNLQIISYHPNRGKGYAVKQGVMLAQGRKILFIDADGSIHPNQIPKLVEKLEDFDVVVGDRTSKNSNVRVVASRKLIGELFNFYVAIIFNTKFRDNLCGFKGFKADIAKDLFKDLVAERWLFDVELFYKIKKRHYTLYTLSFDWVYKPGTKMRFIDPFKMIYQLIFLRIHLISQ